MESVNLISSPAVYSKVMSNWFNPSSHRVKRALYCLYLFYSFSVMVPELGDWRIAVLVFRISEI